MGLMHLLGLHSLYGIGAVRLKNLITHFGDYEAAWLGVDEWEQVLGSGPDYDGLRREWQSIDLPRLYEKFLLSDAKVVTLDDAHYPQLLRTIPEPPYLLFYRGELPGDDTPTLAIIGSRRATPYGREVAGFFAGALGQAGVWVISGMARGIDTVAHRAALAAGGKTIGVLGCGIDIIYPQENRELFAETAANGCIISEYPLGTRPVSRNFPIRNRVISGLSRGVLVVEAGLKSGTQITVDYAKAQGRTIYAVPGSIFSPVSMGTFQLIKEQRAKPVATAQDILVDLHGGTVITQTRLFDDKPAAKAVKQAKKAEKSETAETSEIVKSAAPLSGLGERERRVVEYLTEQRHFNDMIRELGWQSAELASTLTLLELSGFIRRLDGQYYIRSRS